MPYLQSFRSPPIPIKKSKRVLASRLCTEQVSCSNSRRVARGFLDRLQRFGETSLTWCDLGVALTFAGMQIRQPKLLEKYPRLKHFVDKVTANEVVSHFIETELAPSAVLRKNSM
ncbi:hypothetical protein AVEN_23619-1 [Araneus ventricosus]|uniref:Glutathione S-transferase C-terminal domain-containing protein n=1 Tax=Araneus ventricosus TaxID=182803 RepID=A0A4Y2BJZ5_ARAVE|nr:hypothetical protein AVEN_23619-1 [Araneus ventricosus]